MGHKNKPPITAVIASLPIGENLCSVIAEAHASIIEYCISLLPPDDRDAAYDAVITCFSVDSRDSI